MIGEICGLATACVWSLSSIMFAGAIRRLGSVQVNVARLIFAAILLLVTILAAGLSMRLSFAQVAYLGVSGCIGLVFGDTFLFKSFQVNGARVSMLIMSLAPAISAILAFIVLGELLSLLGIVGIVITTIGIAVVVVANQQSASAPKKLTQRGLIYGFFGALGQGAGLVCARLAFNEGEINGFVATFVRIAASLVVLLPMAIATKRFQNPVAAFSSDKRALMLTIGGAIFGPYLGITFSLIAITYTKVGIAATLMATVPILMLPLVRIIYKERLTWHAVLGACVAVAGVAILFLR